MLFNPTFLIRSFHVTLRHSRFLSKNAPVVRVHTLDEDESVKVSFKYSNSPYLNLTAPKNESVQSILTRIKLTIEIQRKKEELRQSVINKYYPQNADKSTKLSSDSNSEIEVHLLQNDSLVDTSIPNRDAWFQASSLKIGDTLYEVNFNTPIVNHLSLPQYIISGCPVRPHCVIECACLSDCTFTWYRSISEDQMGRLANDEAENNLLNDGEKCWLKVHEGLIYFTGREDVDCFLKVVCTPKMNDREGPSLSAQSPAVVEAGEDVYPFEERQESTHSFCGDKSIRCLSYNVLASVYVDRKKFPYASIKARDNYFRRQLIGRELPGYNSDIICLQEVQERMFENDLVPVLNRFGYVGFYTRKGGHRYEGLATFIHLSKFKIVRQYGVHLNQVITQKHIYTDLLSKVAGNLKDMSKVLAQDTALQVILLEHARIPDYKLIVANTHLYSNKDMPEVRLIQAAVCSYFIEHVVKVKDLLSAGLIFCGDFNSLPTSTTFEFLTSGKFECSASWKNNYEDGDLDSLLSHNLCLDSACGTPEYTNYTHEFQGCLDYIFYSKNTFDVSEIVPMPRHEKVIEHVGLPNELFPSDHIPIICTLDWKT